MIWTVFFASWAVTATIVIVVLFARQSDSLRFPDLFAPVTDEERNLRELNSDKDDIIRDLRIRLKHAEQERERALREAAVAARAGAVSQAQLWRIRRVLDNEPAAAELVGVERAG